VSLDQTKLPEMNKLGTPEARLVAAERYWADLTEDRDFHCRRANEAHAELNQLKTEQAECRLKFNKGDRVEHIEDGCIGTVVGFDKFEIGGFGYLVKWDNPPYEDGAMYDDSLLCEPMVTRK
jgi:hypothetical protein